MVVSNTFVFYNLKYVVITHLLSSSDHVETWSVSFPSCVDSLNLSLDCCVSSNFGSIFCFPYLAWIKILISFTDIERQTFLSFRGTVLLFLVFHVIVNLTLSFVKVRSFFKYLRLLLD